MRSWKYVLRKLIGPKVMVMQGLRLLVPSSLPPGVRKALYKETYEDMERKLVGTALASGDRVLEVGSGIGVVALCCARIVGPDNLLCYEANPLMSDLIARNFALNGLTPNLVNRAMTLRGGPVEFFQNGNIVSSGLFKQPKSKAVTVPSDGLNDVIERFRPTVLVMDIEGAEVELLTYAALSGIAKIIIEVHPRVTGADAVRRLLVHLESNGFVVRAQSPNSEVLFLSK
jgi:FkbM family methyltransferase